MNKPQFEAPARSRMSQGALPVLLVLFAGSGCAALVYEIVWFQLLQLVIGSSAVSLGILLGTFMGGMCLGSVALPRLLSVRRHPLRVYAAIELALGGIGVAVLFGMPYAGHVYTAFAGDGLPGMLLRGAVAAVCLLPPTVLMGATLPAVARWVEATPKGVSWLGFFYGGNIAGAVCGCLLAGFYLLRVHDLAVATYAAAAVNVAVALVSFGLAALTPYDAPHADPADDAAVPAFGSWAVYVAVALSGACALGAEVIWTRLLSLMLGATVYTFSIILAVFLVGLGIGSALGSLLAREAGRPRAALGWCQLLLAPAIAWTAFALTQSLPHWPINTHLAKSSRFIFELDLVRCLWALLPATCLWGASFPLALAAVAAPGRDPGRLVGGVYAANTVGAIAGALGASLFLIRWAGMQNAQRVLIALSAAAAILVFVSPPRPIRVARTAGLAAAAGLAALFAWSVTGLPWELVAFGRTLPTYAGGWSKLYVGEGLNSTVAVTQIDGGARNFHVSGKVEASTEPQDMRLQRMLGHLPALFHPRPRSVLVVGCGAGVTAGSFVTHPGVERIVVCEIEPLIPRNVAPYFAAENYGVVRDPRVQIVHDDARHYVLRTPEKFDVITSDPIHPWVKGSATLYTQEYFELCKRHLNPGGVISQWVPLYESSSAAVQSQIATFFDVFPHGTVWGNDEYGEGYDLVLLARAEPTRVDVDELQQRLERDDHAAVARSLKDVGFNSALNLLASYAGRASDLRTWLGQAQINRDRNLRLQYLAGLGLNAEDGKRTYQEMLLYRAFPEDLFVGSGLRSRALRGMLARLPREP